MLYNMMITYKYIDFIITTVKLTHPLAPVVTVYVC